MGDWKNAGLNDIEGQTATTIMSLRVRNVSGRNFIKKTSEISIDKAVHYAKLKLHIHHDTCSSTFV